MFSRTRKLFTFCSHIRLRWKGLSRHVRQTLKVQAVVFPSIAGIFSSVKQDPPDEDVKKQSPLEKPDMDTLTSQYLLKNATMVSVESATTLLCFTTTSLCALEEEYVKGLYVLIKLMEVKLEYLGQPEHEKIENLIMETRNTVNKSRTKLQDMELLYHTARKLVTAAGEAAYLAGAEYATVVTNNTLSTAETHMNSQQQNRVRAELEYAETEAKTIEAESKHAEEKERRKKAREEREKEERTTEEQATVGNDNQKDSDRSADQPAGQTSGEHGDNSVTVKDIFNLRDEEYFKAEPSMSDG